MLDTNSSRFTPRLSFDNALDKLEGRISQLKKLEKANANNVKFEPGRRIPVGIAGDHHSIFGDRKISSIHDIPIESVKNLFCRISEHPATKEILLGAYDRRSKSRDEPCMRLTLAKGRLTGTLLVRGVRQNSCSIQIFVQDTWETSVLNYLDTLGVLL